MDWRKWCLFPVISYVPIGFNTIHMTAQLMKNLSAMQDRFDSWVGKIHWRRDRLPTPVFWPREFYRLYSPWGCKESDMTEWLSHRPIALKFLFLAKPSFSFKLLEISTLMSYKHFKFYVQVITLTYFSHNILTSSLPHLKNSK